MAATLTPDQDEVVHYSFPIEKREDTETVSPVDGTPDIWIWGKATDGTVDGDREIVDPEWSAKALQQWADTGGNVRMSHDAKRPVGKGHQVQVTTDGHYVKSLIADPLAKHFIRQGVLNDYSVGISGPDFRYGDRRLDPEGKALRVITGKADGSSRVVELSVVDRGSNFNSRFQMVRKSAGDGFEFTGQMVGDEDEIAKAAPAALTKAFHGDTVNVDVPKSATITFSPDDLAKLLDHRRAAEERETEALKAVIAAESAVYKRDIDVATRRRLLSQGRALPGDHPSYPIENHEDAGNAVTLALSGHGNVAAAKKLIRRIARKEGWQDILDRLDGKTGGDAEKADGCKTCGGSGKIMDGHRDCPDCDGASGDADAGKEVTPAVAKDDDGGEDDGKDEEEGALHHDDGQDDDTDSDADAMDKSAAPKAAEPDMAKKPPKVPCPACKKPNKAKARFCGKCGASMTAEKASKPTPADHAEGAAEAAIQPVPEHREPDGPAFEAFEHDAGLPTVPDADVMQRVAAHHKAIGVPYDAGWLHDLLCPAFAPGTAKMAHPLADLGDAGRDGVAGQGPRHRRQGAAGRGAGGGAAVAARPHRQGRPRRPRRRTGRGTAQGVPRRQPRPREGPRPRRDPRGAVQPALHQRRPRRPVTRPRRPAQGPGARRAHLRVRVPPGPARGRPRGGLARQHEPAARAHRSPGTARRPLPGVLHAAAAGQRPAGDDQHARPHRQDVPRRLPHARAGADGRARSGHQACPRRRRRAGAARGQQGRGRQRVRPADGGDGDRSPGSRRSSCGASWRRPSSQAR